MKTSAESHPRVLCRLVRGWSALAGDPTTGAAARHIAACPACREFFATSTALETRLRTAAVRRARPLPEGFEQRMARALAPVTRPPAAPADGSRTVLWSFFGTLGAAVVVAFVLFRLAENPPGESPLLADHQPALSVPATGPSSDEVILASLTENPLQREINHVYSDAQAALRFLALNFLPAPVDAPRTEAGSTSS